jgi:hypothetical protein
VLTTITNPYIAAFPAGLTPRPEQTGFLNGCCRIATVMSLRSYRPE